MDVGQRLRRIEAVAGLERPVFLWADERPPADALREAFGEAGPPPGTKVMLLSWAGSAEDMDDAATPAAMGEGMDPAE